MDSWVGKICWRRDRLPTPVFLGFPCGSAGKESVCNAGDLHLIPGLGRSPGEGKGFPLPYSGLENYMDCMVHRVVNSGHDFHSLTHFLFFSLTHFLETRNPFPQSSHQIYLTLQQAELRYMLESDETPKVELNQLGFISELGISHVREDGSLNETQFPLAKENGGGLL